MSAASMFEHHPHAVVLIGATGLVRETNFAMERLLGVKHGLAAGMPMAHFIAAQDAERLSSALARASRLEPVQDFALTLSPAASAQQNVIATLAPAAPADAGVFLILRPEVTGLRPVLEQLASAERTLQLQAAAFEALPAHVALLDSSGRITAVNEAWRRFGRENGLEDPAFCIGDDYLAACRRATADSPEAAAVLVGLGEVLEGSRPALEIEYPCHGPMRRWFRLHANAIRSAMTSGAIVMHVDVTERHLAKEQAKLAARAFRRVSKAVKSLESERRHRLAHSARHDELTGLASQGALESFARQAIGSAAGQPGVCALLLVNLDRFRLLNESLGHARADALLKAAASRLRSLVPPGDMVARLGADEFALMLVGLPDAPSAHDHATRIRDEMKRTPLALGEETLSMTVSIGLSCFPGDGDDFETLLRGATVALGEAKKSGPNSIRAYESRRHGGGVPRLSPWSDFMEAIRAGQFEVFYQPCIDLGSGRAKSAEALLRWRHPQLGLLAPDKFIALAEENGSIVELGDWVLGRACDDAVRLRAALGYPIRVAVNLSARQFERADLVQKTAEALRRSGLQAASLRLEITETTVMADPDAAHSILSNLAAMGVGLALDDFGTGYSSLGYLQRFPLTCLKIDRSFVARLPECERSAAIAQTVVLLGRALRMSIVAEGVESGAQLEFLRASGCDEVQGYFFAPAMPYGEVLEWLRRPGPCSELDELLRRPVTAARVPAPAR